MSLALVRALLHFLWQGCLVWGLTALALRASRRPAARYRVACAGLLLCLVLPVAGLISEGRTPSPSTPVRPVPESAALMPLRIASVPEPWHRRLEAPLHLERRLRFGAPYVLTLWMAGALLLTGRAALGLGWVHRARRRSTPLTDPRWTGLLRDLASRLGLRRAVQLRLLEGAGSPFTVGTFRPLLFLPASLLTGLPPALLEALLAHELAHIHRFDYLVNLLQGVVEILLFYHPAVWWISRRIRTEREQACDDLALRILGDPQEKSRDLALALHELDRLQLHTRAAVPAASGGNLMQRIRRLLHPEPRPHGVRTLLATLAFSGVCLAVGYAAQERRLPEPPKPPARVHTGNGMSFSHGVLMNQEPDFSYGLLRQDRGEHIFKGGMKRLPEFRTLRDQGADVLWFREKGVSCVVRDPALLAQAKALFGPVEGITQRMETLSQEMEGVSQGMEAISQEMQAVSHQQDAVSRRMEAASREEERLERAVEKLERRRDRAKAADLAKLDAELQGLEAKLKAAEAPMKALDAEMEKLEGPLKALEARMEEAEKPMQALEARMEPLEAELEKAHAAAEKALIALIREAQAKGLATKLK